MFVTHRVSAAALADRVYVLHEGQVAAEGSHVELLDRSDLYRRMSQGIETGEAIQRLRRVPLGIR